MKVKIFGERNTGTNLLRSLIHRNSGARCYPGTWPEFGARHTARLRQQLGGASSPHEAEALVDAFFRDQPTHLFWKHAFVDQGTGVEDGAVDLTVFLVRDPRSWLLSLYKNPHHLPTHGPEAGQSFNEFLGAPVRTLGRERLGRAELTPPELYQAKVSGYLRLHQRLRADGRRSAIIRFEDLVTDQARTLASLAAGPPGPGAFVPIERSTKDPDKTSGFYADYYGRRLWVNELPAADWQAIRPDGELCEALGYPVDMQGTDGAQARHPTAKSL